MIIVSGGWSSLETSLSAYHIRRVYWLPLAIRQSARVVGTPIACIASETRNSRTLLRSTARPSPPREKGVVPEPFSWSSQRWRGSPVEPGEPSSDGLPMNSPSETARPSP